MAESEDKLKAWDLSVMSAVVGGFFIMMSLFFFFIGTYGVLHDPSHRPKDLINKAVLGAPLCFYLGAYLFLPASRKEDPDAEIDREMGYTPSQFEWMVEHWVLVLGCIAFEALVLTSWVVYLHHHGFKDVF
jgi:hypothetical protein